MFEEISMLDMERSNIIPTINYLKCQTNIYLLVHKIIEIFSNVCLNNYVKHCNDNIQCEKDQRKLKKLKT